MFREKRVKNEKGTALDFGNFNRQCCLSHQKKVGRETAAKRVNSLRQVGGITFRKKREQNERVSKMSNRSVLAQKSKHRTRLMNHQSIKIKYE